MKRVGPRWSPTPLAPASSAMLQERDRPMKDRPVAGFGSRLATLRQARGLSQEALAAEVDVSRRTIAYYEAESAQPPGAHLKRLQRVAELPPADQRAVLQLVDAMLDTRHRATPATRVKRKAS
jgi:ribosome-binding protein aMBF1 (putative translation factor)